MATLTETAGPLYEKVKDYIRDHIARGAWGPNERLPSENDLVATLGVSRMTVNRALRELSVEGVVLRIQGVGTFVAPPRPQSALIEINNIAEEIAARGHRHRAEVAIVETVERPTPALVAAFEFSHVMPVAHSIVIHYENDLPVQREERFVNRDLAPDYEKQDFTSITSYEYLTRLTPLTEVEHVISAIAADRSIARDLKVPRGAPCLLLKRRTWSGPVVATVNRLIYAGERYSLGSRYAPDAVRS